MENKGIEKLIFEVIDYKNSESIGLIYDKYFYKIGSEVINFCNYNNIKINSLLTEYESGQILTENIKSYFINDIPEIIILGLSNNIWHTKERKFAINEKKKRIINLLHPDNFCESYLANINFINNIGSQIKEKLDNSELVHIISKAGTNISAKIGKSFCESKYYNTPCCGGDFPIGEVGFWSFKNSVNGRIVYDFKVQHVGFTKNNPEIIDIKNDKIYFVKNSNKFKNFILSNKVFNFVSEISIGINPIWVEVNNIDSIVEEKNLGTSHFGQGGSSYINRIGPHFDSVILNPTIYFDNMKIMDDGVLNQKYIKYSSNE